MEINDITNTVIGAAMKIHSAIGPGVLESVYRKCLQHELHKAGLAVQSELKLPVHYDGLVLESGYRL
jgi:GxxExxY protein